MFADIKSAGTIVVQEVLLEFLPVGFGGKDVGIGGGFVRLGH